MGNEKLFSADNFEDFLELFKEAVKDSKRRKLILMQKLY